MKKAMTILAAVLVTGLLSAALAGCSGGGSSASASAASSASASASASSAAASSSAAAGSLFNAGEWPEGSVGQIVPKPSFSYAPSSIHESEGSANIQYEQADEAEVAAWVDAVKAAGFTVDASESKGSVYSYVARNDNRDMVSITLRQSDDAQPKLLIQLSQRFDIS